MSGIAAKFLTTFIPTCALAVFGSWLARGHSGFWGVVGWIVALFFGCVAILQMLVLHDGLRGIHRATRRLRELEERDAQSFREGKSFDEITSQYKRK